jgi:crossover junction endodeoxyribonuclease RusA
MLTGESTLATELSVGDTSGVDVHLVLPWPPSVNAYYRHLSKGPLAGRTLISKDGRIYRDTVTEIIKRRNLKTMESRLMVTIEANPPDRRRRDLDNLLKALLDALVHSGVIADDSLIDHLTIYRGPRCPAAGKVSIDITELEEATEC